MRTAGRLVWAGFWAGAAMWAADALTEFRPSATQTEYGIASEVEFSTPPVELEGWSLAHHSPGAMKNFRFAEPVWVIGYKTVIVPVRVKSAAENYLCHTFFADQRVMQKQDDEFKGIYSDAFTPEVRLPEGFGLPVAAGEGLHWMPMFNNRGEVPARVAMKVILTVIRAKDLKKPLKPLYANLRSVEVPHLYFVKPGRDQRQVTFQSPFDGRIHFLGTHIHPYGVSVELFNVTRGQVVWKGMRRKQPDGPMEVYSSANGHAMLAGESYRITAVYENPTGAQIDAMAGLFMMYSRN